MAEQRDFSGNKPFRNGSYIYGQINKCIVPVQYDGETSETIGVYVDNSQKKIRAELNNIPLGMVIDDQQIAVDKTWSSEKINQELGQQVSIEVTNTANVSMEINGTDAKVISSSLNPTITGLSAIYLNEEEYEDIEEDYQLTTKEYVDDEILVSSRSMKDYVDTKIQELEEEINAALSALNSGGGVSDGTQT